MNALFAYVLEMSIAGSLAILAVLVFRAFLKKAPRWIVCSLWALVAIRLLFPLSIESPFSFSPPQKEQIHVQIQKSFVKSEEAGSFWESLDPVDQNFNEESKHPVSESTQREKTKTISIKFFLPLIWLTGVAVMLVLMGASYLRIKIQMATSVPYSKGIRQSEFAQSPFILGLLRPMIYLPFGLDEWTILSVLAHEKAHIKRGDHIIKPFAWLLLSIHWFNPLLWLSYALLCKDIEGACDEKVLADMNEEERRDYARALLKCSTRSVGVYACPLAFGELNVKGRIKMTLSYKKPVFWVIVLSLVIALIATVGILTDPVVRDEKEPADENKTVNAADQVADDEADWWGEMEDFEIQANAKNSVFKFKFNKDIFQKKAINKNDKNWSDPVMVAENMDQLSEILDGCLKNPIENEQMIGRVNQYFEEKAEGFGKIYPALTAPDFFENHVVMVVFSTTRDDNLYVEKAILEKTEDKNLKVTLDVAYAFEKKLYVYTDFEEGIPTETVGVDDGDALKFYWISKDTWKKFNKSKIEFYPTTEFRPEWIHYNNYMYQSDQAEDPFYIMLRWNNYDEYPLVAGVDFGKTYLEESRERYADFYYPEGNADEERVKYLQVQHATFNYPATKEDNTLTINQCSFRGGKILATHVFKMENDVLIYDAAASPDKIPGLPDGATFSLKEPTF